MQATFCDKRLTIPLSVTDTSGVSLINWCNLMNTTYMFDSNFGEELSYGESPQLKKDNELREELSYIGITFTFNVSQYQCEIIQWKGPLQLSEVIVTIYFVWYETPSVGMNIMTVSSNICYLLYSCIYTNKVVCILIPRVGGMAPAKSILNWGLQDCSPA